MNGGRDFSGCPSLAVVVVVVVVVVDLFRFLFFARELACAARRLK